MARFLLVAIVVLAGVACVLGDQGRLVPTSSSHEDGDSGHLSATFYPQNIVQGSEVDRHAHHSGCPKKVREATCCKTPEQRCCSKKCFRTPEYKPEQADHVSPELKEKKCSEQNTLQCCSASVQSCCTHCPRFAEEMHSAEYQGRLVSPVIECTGHRRSRLCCSSDSEHLSTCCTPRTECGPSTKVGDMKMGTLQACPEEKRSQCCQRVSDTCCKPCGERSARILVEADLAPLHDLGSGNCPETVHRCCSSQVQRCCNQCASPLISNFLEYQASEYHGAVSSAVQKSPVLGGSSAAVARNSVPLSAMPARTSPQAQNKHAYKNSLTPVDYDNQDDFSE